MKILRLLVLAVTASMLGCTSDKLKRSTVNQGGTLAEINYAQVLTNLAMFCSNSEFVPSLVTLRDGSCQIADVGSAQYMGDWHKAFKSQPSILGSRTVVEQWGMSPVTDDNELQLLQIAYRRAIGIDESLEEHRDLANDIAHELVRQLPDVDDYRGTIVNHFEDFKNEERARTDKRARINNDPIGRILSYMYPVASDPPHSLADDFSDQTISSVDNKIVYDNEFLRYLSVWGNYKEIVRYNKRYFYLNYQDYIHDLTSPDTKSKLYLPQPEPNPGFDLLLMRLGTDINEIKNGNGNTADQIVVAKVNGKLQFWIFDGSGKLVKDWFKKKLTDQDNTNITVRLNGLWPPHEPTASEKYEVISFLYRIAGREPRGITYHVESDSAAVNSSKVIYVTPEAVDVRRQIRDLETDLLSIPCDRSWFGQGKKHDVPRDACYVGRYGDCYVWVRPSGLKELSNLTIKTLKFSSLIKPDTVTTIPGPRFTPASGFPSP
jgi:hypothetical protein